MNFVQFWDGRAATIEAQAKDSPVNPLEMAMLDEATVVAVRKSIRGYTRLFTAAFPDEDEPISFDNMASAIGAFERGLVTKSRFDDYLEGDDAALTDAERKGLLAFLDAGCATCHNTDGSFRAGAKGTAVGGAGDCSSCHAGGWADQLHSGVFCKIGGCECDTFDTYGDVSGGCWLVG